MTKEEIIELAKQADIDIGMWEKLSDNDDVFGYDFCGIHENLEAFATLVAEKEREACANAMAYLVMTPTLTHGALVKLSDVVNAIRSRGKE